MISNKNPNLALFETIYQAAKNKDRAAISQVLRENYGVDVRNPDGMTPASLLAFEGDIDASEFLRMKYGANPKYIGMGAAKAGDVEYAEFLRNHHHADVNWIAMGAAMGTASDVLQKIREKCENYAESLRLHHDASSGMIAMGAARAGNQVYAMKMIGQGAPIHYLVLGSVKAPGEDQHIANQAERLRIKHQLSASQIARAACEVGRFEYALSKLSEEGQSSLAEGAVLGGYLSFAYELCQKNLDISTARVASAAAEAGYLGFAEQLLEQYGFDMNIIMRGAAMNMDFRAQPYAGLRCLVHVKNKDLRRGLIEVLGLSMALNTLTDALHLNYDQLFAWLLYPELRIWFLQGGLLIKAPEDYLALCLVATRFVPELNLEDARDLYHKISGDSRAFGVQLNQAVSSKSEQLDSQASEQGMFKREKPRSKSLTQRVKETFKLG